jgi:AbiU2
MTSAVRLNMAQAVSDSEVIREIASRAYGGDALEILLLIETMEVQNTDPVNKNLSDAGAAPAALIVRNSLLTRLLILVSREYGNARRGDLSLQRAFDLLEDQKTRAEFSGRGLEITLADAETFWQQCNGDHRLRTVKHLRDKYTAHIGAPENIPLPRYQDVFAFAQRTVTAMEMLARAIGLAGVPVRDQIDARPAAQAFWRPWSGGA